jgi:hypothetical protein
VPGYPAELEAIVMKALAKAPDDRYQTAQDLQLDLEAFAREHKLAMSSISVAKLMGVLFERRNDAWIRAQRAHSDHFIEAGIAQGTPGTMDMGMGPGPGMNPVMGPSASSSSSLPAFLAVGSTPAGMGAAGASDPTAVLDSQRLLAVRSSSPSLTGSQVTPMTGTAAAAPARRSLAPWLIGALAMAVIAGGVTVANQIVVSADERAMASALSSDVERLSSAFDSAARSAHVHADTTAATPVLRQAIETDAATLNDLASNEMIFNVGKGETLDVFQVRDNLSTPLLHLPKTAGALPQLKGRDTKIRLDGGNITMIASAPISGFRANMVGGLVVATTVDLGAIRRSLAQHADQATLTGIDGGELVLAGDKPAAAAASASKPAPIAGKPAAAVAKPAEPGGDSALKLAVRSGGEWNADGVTLTATPKRADGVPWVVPVRNGSAGLAGLLVLCFFVALVRRPRV